MGDGPSSLYTVTYNNCLTRFTLVKLANTGHVREQEEQHNFA